MQLRPNNWSLNAVLGALAWPAALQSLSENALNADGVSFNILLTTLAGQADRWDASLEAFQVMQACALQPDAASLGPCISACSRAGCWKEAAHILRLYSGIADVAAWNAVLAGRAGVGQWQQAFCELEALPSKSLQPDVVTFNSCFSACETARVGQRALELLDHMYELDIRPSAISVNTVVSACEKSSQWQTALRLLFKLPDMHLLPDVISYNAAIAAISSENWQVACSLLYKMLSAQLSPDQVTFGALITACANEKASVDILMETMQQRSALAAEFP